MRLDQRIGKLRALVELSESKQIETKKKVHKIVYLLQTAGEDFDQQFDFHYYGVFSSSLANDLDIAESMTLLLQEKADNDWGYTIKCCDSEASNGKTFELIGEQGRKYFNILSKEEPRLLEVLSTIVYLSRSYYTGNTLKDKLKELKPDLASHYDKAYALAKELYGIDC